jgi:predicted RNA binding protein YcfA (HicA-like mRNA interferase family)
MSRMPRLTGVDLLAALRKAGFTVIRSKGSINFSDMRSAGQLSFPCIQAKSSDPV